MARRTVTRAAPEPRDQSRGTGPRVPDSTASSSLPPVVYDPGDEKLDEGEDLSALSQLGETDVKEIKDDGADYVETFVTADREVGDAALSDPDLDEGPTAEEIARLRALRKPIGALSQKLALPARRGYHRHWFNDTAGRIDEAKASGWAHVKGSDGKPIKRCVGTGRDKNALMAYAMELPLVLWQEDQTAKHQAASAVMDSLKNQPFQAPKGSMDKSDKGKFYDPSDAGPLNIGVR